MSFTGEINQKLAGNFSHRSIIFNKLKLLSITASQAVVTDANKNLVSLAYTNLNTASTLVQRDASGNFSAGTITATITGHSSLDLLASNNLSDLTNVSTARSNLGLVIGTNVEAWSATLDAVAAGTYTGSTSITTLGTISTGTWAGTVIGVTHGGTGLTSTTANQILYSSAANTISGITVVNSAGLLTNGSGVPAWVAYTGSGAPVLATSPTLVTPLLGTPTSGVLTNCTGLPLTTGVTGILPVTNGGTGLNATTANQLLYSSATNTIAGLATAANGVLITSSGSVPSISSTLPNAVQSNITTLGTLTTALAISTTSNVTLPLTVNNNNISAVTSQIAISVGGTAQMYVGYSGTYGISIFNPVTGNNWLYNNKVDKQVLTFNNTLDDGSGNILTVGNFTSTSSITGIYPTFIQRASRSGLAPVVNADNLLLLNSEGYDGSAYQSATYIFSRVDGTVSAGIVPGRLDFYTNNSSGTINLNLTIRSDRSISTTHNTLDNGTTGAASFAGAVTLPGNATSSLQSVPLQQLIAFSNSVNITQHTYAGGF